MKRMCMALGVRTLDDLAHEIEDLATPKMPAGILDALKMLPMVNRLRDLMPKTVSDGPCQESRRKGRVARRHPDPEVLARRRRTATSRCRWSSRKDPETGTRNIGTYRMQVFDGSHDRHALAAAQGRGAALSRRRAARAADAGRGRARPGPGAGLRGHRADAGRARRAAAGRLPAPRARRARQVRDRRSRGARERANHARGLRRARRAPPRRAVRRSHRFLLAP